MTSACFRTLANMVIALALTACVATQSQSDGSTKVHLSLENLTKIGQEIIQPMPSASVKPVNQTGSAKPKSAPISAPTIRTTGLASIFAKHPYDGTSKTDFPRVAITVTDWTRNDCWTATATIWWSQSKSETVPAYLVCWRQSVGYAVNNAANLHLFMQQMSLEHSGNLRTSGPKPPMLAIPDLQPISERQQQAFQGFIQQVVLDTGWQPGAPTNLWLVGYDSSARNEGTTTQ